MNCDEIINLAMGREFASLDEFFDFFEKYEESYLNSTEYAGYLWLWRGFNQYHFPEPEPEIEIQRLFFEPIVKKYVDNFSLPWKIEIVNQYPFIFEFITDKTEELCYVAVERNGWEALKSVPTIFQTPALFSVAVEKDGATLFYVPEHLKSLALCRLAVAKDGFALEYVPDRFKTPEICSLAVSCSGWAIQFVPDHLRTKELCITAVQNNRNAIDYVPERLRNHVTY